MSAAQTHEPLFPAEPIAFNPMPETQAIDGSLLEIAITVLRHRGIVLATTGVLTLATLVVMLLLPNTYTAEVLLLPPDSAQSSAQVLLGQLSPLVTLAGGSTLKSPVEMYGALAASTTIESALVNRFHLKDVYGCKFSIDAMRELNSATRLKPMLKEGLLDIRVTDQDPQRAAALANGYAEEMAAVTTRMAVHDGEVRMQFYGAQLKEARAELAESEENLQRVQEKTGIVDIGTETRVAIQTVSDLRAQIAAHQVEIASMGAWATADNPQHRAAEQQLAALRAQLARATLNAPDKETGVTKSQIPEEGAEYLRAYRELTYQEAFNEALERQYEAARMDAARVSSVVQVLSPAIAPERKSGPQRTLFVLGAMLVGVLFSSLGIVLCDGLKRTLSTEPIKSRAAEIHRLLGFHPAATAQTKNL
jgi:uncharacterized protein involved in exopolysaccharide biosynthesis